MGEVVRVLRRGKDGAWWEVENRADRYVGWVRTWGIVPATEIRARRWLARASARVRVPHAEARVDPRGGALVSPLFWNGIVIPRARRGTRVRVELPDGRMGWVRASALSSGSDRPPSLLARVRSLFGVPYLWGGRTPFGIDCSAFVQQVLFEQGIALPRDAEQQIGACEPVAAGAPERPGDLLFFGDRKNRPEHVGITLGGGYFGHARGTVHVASIDPRSPLYDKALAAQYQASGRPLPGAVWRSEST